MASSYAKHFSLLIFIFLAILFSASSQVEARESRFFSKFTRLIGTVNKVITDVPTSAPAPAPAPEVPGSVPVPAPAPETSFGTETENGYGLYGTQETPVTTTTDVESEKLTGGEERFDNGYRKSNYNYYVNNNNNGYESEKSRTERQGMSDTRFLENGKDYHEVRNDNYHDHQNNYYNGYDDKTAERGTRYVFDSMEEYEKYQESHGFYVP